MPLHYLKSLLQSRREARANRHLGYSLAFIAGAVNAGGFLAVGQYTSHMTGLASALADRLALGEMLAALAAATALLAFVAGAATTALLVNWARRHALHSEFALSLLLEAALLLVFGLLGATLAELGHLLVPVTVLLLCFIMGLQNALITKLSRAEIRTTHLTGMVTDLGIELGKLLYRGLGLDRDGRVRVDRERMQLHGGLVGGFLLGALAGALGFRHLGYIATLPLAAWLALMALPATWDDLRRG